MTRTFETIERNIQTLTTLIHKIQQEASPLGSRAVPRHLLAVATLLNRGSELVDGDAETVVAVTGFSKEDGFRVAVVAQDSSNHDAASSKFCFKEVQCLNGSVYDPTGSSVKEKASESSLERYIAELVGLFSTYSDDSDTWTIRALVTFRCFNKLAWRVNADKKYWKGGLVHLLLNWKCPSRFDRIKEVSTDTPEWMKSREPFKNAIAEKKITGSDGKKLILSIANACEWAHLLARLLSEIQNLCSDLKNATSPDRQHDLVCQLVTNLDVLQRFVELEMFLVPLLNVASLEFAFSASSKLLTKTLDDDASGQESARDIKKGPKYPETDAEAEEREETMARVNDESAAVPVLRHLRNIVSWLSAVDILTGDRRYHQFFKSISIGLVETVSTPKDLAEIQYFEAELFRHDTSRRLPKSFKVVDLFDKFPERFTGCTHAEATLMGLLQACALDGEYVEHDKATILNGTRKDLESWMAKTPMLKNNPIAVAKQCCWCCHELARLLRRDKQGSHGIIFPWSPPKVGIPLVVLERLEAGLWERFITAAIQRITPLASQQSSQLNSKHTSGKVSQIPDFKYLQSGLAKFLQA